MKVLLFCLGIIMPQLIFSGSVDIHQSEVSSNIILEENSNSVIEQGVFKNFDGYLSHGLNSLVSEDGGKFTYLLKFPKTGYYKIYAWWPILRNEFNASADYLVEHEEGWEQKNVDQKHLGGQWNLLGIYYFKKNIEYPVSISNSEAGVVIIDALRVEFVSVKQPNINIKDDSLPIATVGDQYRAEIKVEGGSKPYIWKVIKNLPSGLYLDSNTGVIHGTPISPGDYRLQIEVLDADFNNLEKTIKITILDKINGRTRAFQQKSEISSIENKLEKAFFTDSRIEEQQSSLDNLINILVDLPEGDWAKLNLNLYSDAWTPEELRTLKGGATIPTPKKIIEAWSSFAWDSKRGDIIIYGGGHANYSGNDVYRWEGSTQLWTRASLPSEIIQDDFGNWRAIDGTHSAPSSAHTYDNNVYLPIVDRFVTFGGAAYNNGNAYITQVDSTTTRRTGPYFFDPSKADPWKVGGTTGSHVQRVAPYAEILGGEMWENRDIYQNIEGNPPLNHVKGVTAVTQENGKDVVYVGARTGGTATNLYKYTVNDISDPSLDSWEQVGRYWDGYGGDGAGAYNPILKIFVRMTKGFSYWDVNNADPSNRDIAFTPEDPTGEFVVNTDYGLDYDPVRNHFLIWTGTGTVWILTPPEPVSKTGWSIRKEIAPTSEVPSENVGSGILGKWKYISNLDAFIGLLNEFEGNVWLYKPYGWQNPGASNNLPIVSLTRPTDGAVFTQGEDITIEVEASDSDGSIVQVEFFQGSVKLGESTVPPYSFIWQMPAVGTYTLTAIATDDTNASTTSSVVNITVSDGSPEVSIIEPVNGAEFIEGEDITLLANASDSDGSITLVEFYQGNEKIGESTVTPYTYTWVSPVIGSYVLSAIATDNAGNSTTSNLVDVNVLDEPNILPSVSISDPANGAVYTEGEEINILADASDSDGSISIVEFFLDGVKLGDSTFSPYSFTWQTPTTGTYTLTAIATDNDGGSTVSDAVSVIISDGNSIVVNLQDGIDGYAGTRDSYISDFHQATNFGNTTSLLDKVNRYKGMYRFKVFQSEGGLVPDGADILSATLGVYKHSTYNYTYQAHRILRDWEEDQVNWNERSFGVLWSEAGALINGVDVAIEADGEGSVGWEPQWLEIDVTTGLQMFREGQINYGWQLVPKTGNNNKKKFYSREYTADPLLRPKLTIEYSLD